MDGSLAHAAALHAEAVQQQNRGRPAQALRTLDRALRAIDGRSGTEAERLTTAILLTSAWNRAEVSGAAAALETVEAARQHAQAAHDEALVVRARSQEALIAMRTGRVEVAYAAFRAAEPLLRAADDNDRFAVLNNLGTLHLYEGRPVQARPYLRRAAEVARRAGLRDAQFKAAHNLGYADFLTGDLPAALAGMAEALELGWGPDIGVALLDRARVLVEAGLVRESDAALARAAEMLRRDHAVQDLAETELERARSALVAGDAAAARRFAMRARDRFRRRGNDRWRRTAELVLLQADLAAGRPGLRLLPPAVRLHEELRAAGAVGAARTAALLGAEAALAASRTDTAAELARRAGRASRADPITARLHAALVHARLEAARGRPGAAARRVGAALDDLAAYQAGFGSIDLATAAAVHGRRIAALGVSLALDTGRPDVVLEASERARAVTNRVLPVRPPDDPAAAGLLADLRQVTEALRGVEQAADAALQRRRRALEAAIRARGWQRSGPGALREPVTAAQVADTLADRTLVSYVRSAGRLHAVVVTTDGCRLCPLGSAALVDEHVRRLRADLDALAAPGLAAPLRVAVQASLGRTLMALEEQLLAPLSLGPGPLVVASTGLLGQLAWPLLPALRSVPVAVAPSATAWATASAARPTSSGAVVSVAGPEIARGVEEARHVAAVWGGAVLTGAAAGTAAVARALASERLVHVAAHGSHQIENPLFSCLQLADGALFAHELDAGARAAEHVVLSACELGLATLRPGDEALGLTSVLLRLETRSVVAGVARVADETAADVMLDYHRRLAAGADSASALAQAVAAAWDGAADRRPPPPFVCFGAAWSAPPRSMPEDG